MLPVEQLVSRQRSEALQGVADRGLGQVQPLRPKGQGSRIVYGHQNSHPAQVEPGNNIRRVNVKTHGIPILRIHLFGSKSAPASLARMKLTLRPK